MPCGARANGNPAPEARTTAPEAIAAPPPAAPAPTSPAVRLAGVLALASLLACLLLPLLVLLSDEGDRASRIELFKGALLACSLLYFVSGSAWIYRRGAGAASAG